MTAFVVSTGSITNATTCNGMSNIKIIYQPRSTWYTWKRIRNHQHTVLMLNQGHLWRCRHWEKNAHNARLGSSLQLWPPSSIILQAGVLHIAFAAMHALGKTIDGSGIDIKLSVIELEHLQYFEGYMVANIHARYWVRHRVSTISLAIMMMRFGAMCQVSILKKARHERTPDMAKNKNDFLSRYTVY